MKHDIPLYRPFGEPAVGLITVGNDKITGNKVTINGDDFILGTNFGGEDAVQIARSLADAINLGSTPGTSNGTTIVRPYFAYYSANQVRIVATAPGLDGNSITLTETGTSFYVSGVTLSGGTAGVVDFTLSPTNLATSAKQDILAALFPASLGTKTPALSLATTPSKWVRHSISLAAGETQAIPDGAIYQYSIFTGTGGDGTMTNLPAGYSDGSPFPIVTGFTLTMNTPGTAAVVWFTAT